MKITVELYFMPLLNEKMSKLANIASKLGCVAPTYNIVRTYSVKNPDTYKVTVFNEIEIIGAAPKLEGWEFVAKFDHDEKIVYQHGWIPTEFSVGVCKCDHCCVSRYRKVSYIVKNDVGIHMQVGGSCLKHYTGGHKLPTILGRYFDGLTDLESDGWRTGHASTEYDLTTVLKFARHAVNVYGYVRSAQGTMEIPSTSSVVMQMISGNRDLNELVKAALQIPDSEVLNMLEFVNGMPSNDESYVNNLKSIVINGYCTFKSLGFAVSIVSAYDKAQAVRRAADSSTSVHLGQVGERLRNLEVEVTSVRVIEGTYDYTTVVNMVSGDSVLVWFAAGSKDISKGDAFTLTGTVKSHSEYAGIKQTILTRCKID